MSGAAATLKPGPMSDAPLLRWSSVRDCPRKAVYEATGAPARERTEAEQRWLYRGRSIGRDYIVWLARKYGKVFVASGDNWWVPPDLRADNPDDAAILSEVPVRWPLGIGHIDGFLKETGTALEFLSSAHADADRIHSKLLQLVGYSRYYEPAENACLVVLDPSSLEEERWPIAFDTERFRELLEECEARVAEVVEWRATGKMPARVCAKPQDARSHFCLHADHCFDDHPLWAPPTVESVTTDPAVVKLAADLHAAKGAEKAAKAVLADAEAARKTVEAQLAEHVAATPKEGVQVGPFLIKRTHVQRSATLDWRKAELAGVLNTDALGEFLKPGAEYHTTSIERTELDAPDLDFGPVPF